MPVVELTDILVEVDAWTGFSAVLRRDPARAAEAPEPVYAALLAAACNISLADMARSSGLDYQVLWWAAHQFLQDDDLRAATVRVVNQQHGQWLARHWGGGRPVLLRRAAVSRQRGRAQRQGPPALLRLRPGRDVLHPHGRPLRSVRQQGHSRHRARRYLCAGRDSGQRNGAGHRRARHRHARLHRPGLWSVRLAGLAIFASPARHRRPKALPHPGPGAGLSGPAFHRPRPTRLHRGPRWTICCG
ncbi:MAG: Tn3 family transposase [Hymenobacter sp.]